MSGMYRDRMKSLRKTLVLVVLLSAVVLTACSPGVEAEKPQKTDISSSSSSVTETEDGSETVDKTNENGTAVTGNLNASEYIFKCVDEDDMPVSGVTLQICTDETCFLAKSDENGVIEYAGEPFGYEIHVYRYDEGYEPVTDTGFTTAAEYGTYEIRFRHRYAED